MSSARRFLLDTISRIGSSILAGSLVSCLIIERLEVLHIVLMLTGAALTAFGYPAAKRASA